MTWAIWSIKSMPIHVEGNLTDEERTELLELARNNPDPTYSYRFVARRSQGHCRTD